MSTCVIGFTNYAVLDAATITASSEVAGMGASNLKNTIVRQRLRTAAGVTTFTLSVDLGAARTVGVLALLQPSDAGGIDADNAAKGHLATTDTIRHRLDATTPGAGVDYDSGVIACGIEQGYGVHVHVLPASETIRYWQADIVATSLAAADKPGYVDFGFAWIGPAFQPTINHSYDNSVAENDLSQVATAQRSGTTYAERYAQPRVLTLPFDYLTDTEAKGTYGAGLRAAGRVNPVLAVPDPASATIGCEALIGRFDDPGALSQVMLDRWRHRFVIRELL